MARIELALTCTFAGYKLNTCHRHNRVERKGCRLHLHTPTAPPTKIHGIMPSPEQNALRQSPWKDLCNT